MLGSFGITWSIIWIVISSDSPNENFFLKKEEKDFIETQTKIKTNKEKSKSVSK